MGVQPFEQRFVLLVLRSLGLFAEFVEAARLAVELKLVGKIRPVEKRNVAMV
jgi:hypothetical protein